MNSNGFASCDALPYALSAMSIDDHNRTSSATSGGEDSIRRKHGGGEYKSGDYNGGEGIDCVETSLQQLLSDAELAAFQRLDPEQQRQAMELFAQHQQHQQHLQMEERPEEHHLTIALNGELGLFLKHFE